MIAQRLIQGYLKKAFRGYLYGFSPGVQLRIPAAIISGTPSGTLSVIAPGTSLESPRRIPLSIYTRNLAGIAPGIHPKNFLVIPPWISARDSSRNFSENSLLIFWTDFSWFPYGGYARSSSRYSILWEMFTPVSPGFIEGIFPGIDFKNFFEGFVHKIHK